ncbi:MAG TPA: hypothetical protein DD638_11790 [Pasteurellaceae bacterium]|nr:hypothetical protein [Pasteurellaceae bacterium]
MAVNYKKLKVSLLVLLGCIFSSACEVVELDSAGRPIIPMSAEEAASFKNMEPKDIADKVWMSLVQEAGSSPLALAGLAGNTQNDKSYFVKFSGMVEGIDDKSGSMNLNIKTGDEIIPVQVGSIVRGNALRDATSLIKFDQFKNQIQFARLSKELNKKAIAHISKPDPSWIGKNIEILTALTIKNNQIQDVVPIEINIAD